MCESASMRTVLTEAGLLKLLRAAIDRQGSQVALAKAVGISPANLSDVLSRKRNPGEHIQKYLGVARRIVYERVK